MSMEINLLDTMWVLIASFLVFIMHLGFTTIEAGLTRSKNTISIITKNVFTIAMGSIIFMVIGFTLAFSGEGKLIGDLSYFMINGLDSSPWPGLMIPAMAFFLFQAMFAATSATIVSGAVAERIKFSAYILVSVVLVGLIYPIIAHWIWGGGWLSSLGFHDFAGSTVVHSVGGWTALATVIILGPRFGKFDSNGKPQAIAGHNIGLAAIGCLLLWFGWFGFNPGSELALTENVPLIAITTNIAAAGGGIAALTITKFKGGKPDIGMFLNGILAGLVAITAPCAVVSPQWALVIGLIAGIIVVYAVEFIEAKLKIDDPVGAISVHGVCGFFGTISVGLFSSANGLITTGSASQLFVQLIGSVATFGLVFVSALIVAKVIDMTIGLRVPAEVEIKGLDITEFGGDSYPDFIKM
ncbi:MAG: putative ammonium transporter [Candidatus Methanofastidiosum methylothiophilum]|uniref:Ammonium transporter n=1 Tax=Candidatus Methanofastidiosum methylothiophilum TaxID=1705564 RepID=A0A150ILT8_9EURY|nr:MAG: putative ammonium transporter [Candidatus Methanofastidiosum methylthiophilus]KYC48234.1 MAG: putative ammonium transporter [Candidatus Methanofastidiosum methylthiophilus]KYC50891.1 MAG: putative ammonium transporter [Candidatus Methanofastidiosum methylthiophilus]